MFSCTVISKEIGTPLDYKEGEFQNENTHYSDVIDLFGPPSKLSKHKKGMVFLYEWIDINERQLGFSSKNILQWFKFSIARGEADRKVLVLMFDEKGYLTAHRFNQFEEKIGSGQGVSIIISVQSLVDTSNLEEPPETLLWGRNLLDPLPEVFNIPHNLKSGKTGVEQLGSPNTVGQHTLEMVE